MDLLRIFSRLRSNHFKSRRLTRKPGPGKPALVALLYRVVFGKAVKISKTFTKGNLDSLRADTQKLYDLFIRLENIIDPTAEAADVREVVGEIVKAAHEFTLAIDLTSALEAFSCHKSVKRYLPEAIAKLGRYYSISSELVSAARDKACRVFRDVHVAAVHVASIEGISQRIHAEMQLLFHYEFHPDHPKPRIIASNKSACYLCNLYFRLHCGFIVPRSHGRLYNTWTLPDLSDIDIERRRELETISFQFKKALNEKICELSSTTMKQYEHPNESVLLLLAHGEPASTLSDGEPED
jgi:OTT_1508-like deaminase